MDAYTTNSSYWQSSGVGSQQWVMYSYNVHDLSNLKFGIKFRTSNTTADKILFSKDGVTTREFNILTTNGGKDLSIGLFKTNATFIVTTIPNSTDVYNNGKWHTLEAQYNSNGAGAGGVLSITFDGITTSHTLSTIDSIQRGIQSICLNGSDGGYGPIVFDCEYVSLGERVWTFSSLYSTLVYSNDGEKYFQSVNQTIANVWKLSTDSYVNPYNFINGGYRYTNGNPVQDVILQKELTKYRYNSGGGLAGINTTNMSSRDFTFKSEYFGVSKNIDFRLIIATLSPLSGYRMYISQVSHVHGTITFYRVDAGVDTTLQSATIFTFTMGTDITIHVDRSEAGVFDVKVNGVLLFSVTDTTYTTCLYSQLYNQRHYIVSARAGADYFTLSNYTLEYLGLPSYTSYSVLPPLSFNNSETAFYLPFNQKVEERDTESKLYDHETDTPKNVFYDDLVSGGFGDKIEYRDNGNNTFSNFKVKR